MPSLPPTHSVKIDAPTHKGHREAIERRGSTARGYTYRWQMASKRYLGKHPLCVHCLVKQPQIITAATEVDHIMPHKGDMLLFWEVINWQPLCKPCHSRKTASESSGGYCVQ